MAKSRLQGPVSKVLGDWGGGGGTVYVFRYRARMVNWIFGLGEGKPSYDSG